MNDPWDQVDKLAMEVAVFFLIATIVAWIISILPI
jgi:hypothetical protein